MLIKLSAVIYKNILCTVIQLQLETAIMSEMQDDVIESSGAESDSTALVVQIWDRSWQSAQ